MEMMIRIFCFFLAVSMSSATVATVFLALMYPSTICYGGNSFSGSEVSVHNINGDEPTANWGMNKEAA